MSKYSMGSVELLREQLRLREQNLAKLELQAARHGMDVPLALQNQIDFEIQKIEELRKRLAKAEARPSAAEEEAAVPIWQKVPVWAWGAIGGMVLLILVTGAFLAGRGAKPEPMSTVVARVATPTATSAAMSQPTATPLVPTFTPLPPTDTPVPPTATPVLPTDTPVPTSTPRPTATPVPPTNTPVPTATPQPTPTMDADPTVYDNFNNPANEGGYNTDLWELWHLAGRVAQQDGVLMFTQRGKPEDGTYLGARKDYDVSLDSPTFFEARLMLSPEANAGFVRLALYTKDLFKNNLALFTGKTWAKMRI